jgi:hypothetical protein
MYFTTTSRSYYSSTFTGSRYVKEIKTLDALSKHISPELYLGLLQYRYRKKTRAAHDRA